MLSHLPTSLGPEDYSLILDVCAANYLMPALKLSMHLTRHPC